MINSKIKFHDNCTIYLKKNPPVLFATPTSVYKKYCQSDWIEFIKGLTYPNLRFLIVDNSPDKRNYSELKRLTEDDNRFVIEYYKPYKNQSIAEILRDCTRIVQKEVITGGYKYWFSGESDNFYPQNMIEHFVALQKPVICLSYFHYGGIETAIMNSEIRYINGVRFADRGCHLTQMAFFDGKVKPGFQTGIGCMLMRTEVLRRLKIDIGVKGQFGYGACPDYHIHNQLLQMRIPVYVDTRFISDHYNSRTAWELLQKEKKVRFTV